MFGKKENHLMEIIAALVSRGVRFIICGGVALVLHGVERMTLDLDLSVGDDEENMRKFLRAMKKLGLEPRPPVPPESLLDTGMRRMMRKEKNALVFTFFDRKDPLRQVDVFLDEGFSYDRLKEFVEPIRLGSMTVDIITKEKLLEMKKAVTPPREKDLFDIRALEGIIRGGGSGVEGGKGTGES